MKEEYIAMGHRRIGGVWHHSLPKLSDHVFTSISTRWADFWIYRPDACLKQEPQTWALVQPWLPVWYFRCAFYFLSPRSS